VHLLVLSFTLRKCTVQNAKLLSIPILSWIYLVHVACTDLEMHTCTILADNVKEGDHLEDLRLDGNTV
jgi:hypothetical protein